MNEKLEKEELNMRLYQKSLKENVTKMNQKFQKNYRSPNYLNRKIKNYCHFD